MNGASSTTSSFDKLLGELTGETETLLKAHTVEGDGDADADKQADADGKGETDAGADADADKDKGGEGGEGGEGGGGDDMAKSFEVTLEDGTKVIAQDGTLLVKALEERIEKNESALLKALQGTVQLIKAQSAEITSLKEQVGKLSSAGRGRKTTVTVVQPPAQGKDLAKSEQDGITGDQFLAKAEAAMTAGRISGRDLSLAEACINRGSPIPESIIARVASE